jgi:OmpA family protein
MKRALGIVIAFALCVSVSTHAQTASTQKTLAASIEVAVFPGQGQSAGVQSKDEADCYQWAVKDTGSDPFQLQKQAQANAQASAANAQSTQGSAVRGGARGAAGGALIGAIAGDAGKGAAIGAATGAVVHRSRAKRAQSQNEENIAAAQQATAQQMTNFKKAFSACLEAKKYVVKY